MWLNLCFPSQHLSTSGTPIRLAPRVPPALEALLPPGQHPPPLLWERCPQAELLDQGDASVSPQTWAHSPCPSHACWSRRLLAPSGLSHGCSGAWAAPVPLPPHACLGQSSGHTGSPTVQHPPNSRLNSTSRSPARLWH